MRRSAIAATGMNLLALLLSGACLTSSATAFDIIDVVFPVGIPGVRKGPIDREIEKVFTNKVGPAIGVSPDAINNVFKAKNEPLPLIFDLGRKTVIHMGESTYDQFQTSVALLTAVVQGDFRKIGEYSVQLAGTEVSKSTKNPGTVFIFKTAIGLVPAGPKENYMESPQIILVEPDDVSTDGLGDPKLVYYVNGMRTNLLEAKDEAKALANHLKRPVGLLHNASDGDGSDGVEAVYDKFFPATLTDFAVKLPGTKVAQANRTTRQLTSLLYNTSGRISIVSHSQGCLITRNALLMAERFLPHGSLTKRVAWVATGTPLGDPEILIRPIKYKAIANKNDGVAQVIGVRLISEEDRKTNQTGHSFILSYVKQISQKYLW